MVKYGKEPGYSLIEEHRKKIQESCQNRVAWNKGISDNNHHGWKGGSDSYYNHKARQIIEQNLGRKLTSEETVHHMDHNVRNNSIKNLHLFPNNNKHLNYHFMKMRFVKEILKIGG